MFIAGEIYNKSNSDAVIANYHTEEQMNKIRRLENTGSIFAFVCNAANPLQ